MTNTPQDQERRAESVSLAIKAAAAAGGVSADGILRIAKDIDEFIVGEETK